MPSEIVCPFCGHKRAFVDLEDLFPFIGGRGDDFYRCPCGAVACPEGPMIGGLDPYVTGLETILCSWGLETERSSCQVDLNYITHKGTRLQLLWAKRRPPQSS
ncbi:MAG TPA: hypothetical protein VGT06_09900 [Candidatus Methylomirabilis sp.]|jgi:hypothetical protein|nr:hypothetical protein [Candidatus Methylomirabilis sp.]